MSDTEAMRRVLAAAATAYGQTSPNPMVAAAVFRRGRERGLGVHRRAGAEHAEPQAIAAAQLYPATPRDPELELYVNLEPCVHFGRTPPCADAILATPIARVVTAMRDPDPRVRGRGIARLRAGGIRVDVGIEAAAAAELNHVFVGRTLRRRPFVALKVALDAGGAIAHADRSPAVVTGDEARRDAHRLRAGHDAILIGVETLRTDQPALDRRLYDGPGSKPRRLVLDPDLRARPEWLWPGADPPPVVFCSHAARDGWGRSFAGVAELVALPLGPDGFDLPALPEALAALGLWSVLVEGGGITHRRLLEAGLWDRMYVYEAPGVRLGGLGWAAADAWRQARAGAVPVAAQTLGADRLQVFAHPAAVLVPGDLVSDSVS